MSTVRAASRESGDSRVVMLHPLAIVGVSDHFTRVKLGGSKQDASSPIVGILFGKQTEQEVSIYDALEVAYDETSKNFGKLQFDDEFVQKQKELFTAVYKDRDILGWYTVATEATSEHLALHKQFAQKYNENPLFLLMDPAPRLESKELPIEIFEYELHVVQDTPTMLFVPIPWQLETLQAEQIAMEQVAKTSSSDAQSALYESLDSSLNTLTQRINTMVTYLEKIQQNQLPIDYAILRDVAAIADKLPNFDSDSHLLHADLSCDYNDALTISYLAALTKQASALFDLTDKFNVIQPGSVGGGIHSSSKLA
mmetsp:Transcript_2014/g.3081  ORF Transcript_2014/g.3081 Transcript_2014/m.3081 type:complete len:311 (-) Transcript_2014:130-1062(-)